MTVEQLLSECDLVRLTEEKLADSMTGASPLSLRPHGADWAEPGDVNTVS